MSSSSSSSRVLRGVVKCALSGDTVVLFGPVGPAGVPQERELSLAYVAAPKIARSPDRTDEPYAFASREYLRTLLVGAQVSFTVEYHVDNIKRDFGVLMLGDDVVNKLVVKHGWARVRSGKGGDRGGAGDDGAAGGAAPLQAELQALQAAAEQAGVGMFAKETPKDAVRPMQALDQANAKRLFDALRKEPRFAVVEHVQNAGAFRVCVLPCIDENYYFVLVHLTGVQAPLIKRTPAPNASAGAPPIEEAQPFAYEGRYLAEKLVLQRKVKVVFELLDKQDRVFGSVLLPAGSVSEEILRQGLAKVADWSMGNTEFASKLRAAERQAKEKRMRLWKDYVSQAGGADSAAGVREFRGQVIEAVSGDTLMVAVDDVHEVRVHLSSTRAPRMGRKGEPGEAWAHEARELLRKRAVGHVASVVIDYTRTAADPGVEDHKYATVMLGNQNLAEYVISSGLCSVIRHGASDDNRSSQYDVLLRAETLAKEQQKGQWSQKEAPKQLINDASQVGKANLAKSKMLLPSLQRAGRTPAVVQHVINGGRFVVFVPRDNCLITMSLSGVRVPRAAGKDQAGEPMGDVALAFARREVLQRQAEVQIDQLDAVGTFLGAVFVGKREFSVALLERGLASTVGRPTSEQEALEAEAKAKRIGIWKDFVEAPAASAVAAAPEARERRVDMVSIVVSDIADGKSMHVQMPASRFGGETVEEALGALPKVDSNVDFVPDAKQLFAARFSVDGMWYRARLLEKRSASTFLVRFVDYGNEEVVGLAAVHPLPSAVQAIPPLAVAAQLAYVIVPGLNEDFGEDAAARLRDIVWDREDLVANVEGRAGDTLQLFIVDPAAGASVQEMLLREGLARVEKRREAHLQSVLETLRAAEAEGKRKHEYLWRFGDVYDDDEEDERERQERARIAGGARGGSARGGAAGAAGASSSAGGAWRGRA